jgi:hypothetical protein
MKEKEITIGLGFGRLTVTNLPFQKQTKNYKRLFVTTKCECGVIKDIPCSHLLRGSTKSCGCYRVDLQQKGSVAKNGKKKCSRCFRIKNIKYFTVANNTKDKLNSRCKKCGRKDSLKNKYGIDYDKLIESQNHKCACCKTKSPTGNGSSARKYFVVDHCHKTNIIRGLLCVKCNTVLGKIGDNVEDITKNIQMYIKYLMQSTKDNK